MSNWNGVNYYAVGQLTMKVYFPNGKTDCKHCPHLKERHLRGLCQCSLTCNFIDYANLTTRPPTCPITFKEENE